MRCKHYMNLRSDGRGWRKLELKKRSDVNWSSWHQGFFYNPNTKKNFFNMADGESTYNNEYLMRRDYQELYVRDETINALGDVLNKKGLDLGGGNGTYSHFLTLMGAQMSVQDLSETAHKEGLAQCRKIGINVEYKTGDVQNLQFKDETFDFVISNDFFEHINHQEKINVIKEVSRVLKPGGGFVIKTPNLTFLRISINLKRIIRLLKFKSPFIYIPNTRNNPDCEHHGLTTYLELEEILENDFFFNIERIKTLTRRKYIPNFLAKLIREFSPLSSQIIISCKKSITVPIGDKFALLGKEKEDELL